MNPKDSCVFCKIVRGRMPAVQIYEDEQTLAFMDINPASPGHTLVIAKEHFENLLDITEAPLAAVALTSRRIAHAIQRTLEPDGLRISQFNGRAAGQTVFHYHLHVIPIRAGERVGSHGRGPGDPEEIRRVAAKICAALD